MRKRTSPTILEQAVAVVPEFENVIDKLSNQVTLRGQTKAFYNILHCRCASMGGHEEQCDHCGFTPLDFKKRIIQMEILHKDILRGEPVGFFRYSFNRFLIYLFPLPDLIYFFLRLASC